VKIKLQYFKNIKNINMKTVKFFKHVCVMAMIIASCFVIGCSQYDSEMSVLTNDQKMLEIISEYVIVENNQYVVNLSKEDAVQLSISEFFYTRAVNDLEILNAIIREGLEREKTDSSFSIVFPGRQTSQEMEIDHHIIRLKNGNEGGAGSEGGGNAWKSCGSIQFNYNLSTFPGFFSFSIPKKTKTVKFVLDTSSPMASAQLRINKKGNGLGTVLPQNADYQTISIVYNTYHKFTSNTDIGIKEITPANKAATWDIDVTPESSYATLKASYFVEK
jgi:hypothetical protein